MAVYTHTHTHTYTHTHAHTYTCIHTRARQSNSEYLDLLLDVLDVAAPLLALVKEIVHLRSHGQLVSDACAMTAAAHVSWLHTKFSLGTAAVVNTVVVALVLMQVQYSCTPGSFQEG